MADEKRSAGKGRALEDTASRLGYGGSDRGAAARQRAMPRHATGPAPASVEEAVLTAKGRKTHRQPSRDGARRPPAKGPTPI